MQRTKSVAIGLLALLVVGVLAIASHASKSARTKEAEASAARTAPSVAPAPPPAAAPPTKLENAVEVALSPAESSEGFDVLPDGRKAPPVPDSAPQRISFGVIQFTYEGAQFAPKGARSKADAKARASAAIEQASKDFSAAVARGDLGSSTNMGRMPRGILEPALEYLLFTLPKGQVHPEPIDTPRGYWVVRRID